MARTRVLISGGLGFIGQRLAHALAARGDAIHVFDSLSPQVHGAVPHVDLAGFEAGSITVTRGDVTSREDWERALDGADCVVHLAAETGTGQSMYAIGQYERVNGLGTALLLDVLANRTHRVRRVVLASSRAVYGEGQYRCVQHGTVHPEPRSLAQLKAGRFDVTCPRCASAVEPEGTRETAIPRPSSIYAATKLAQEELIRIGCSSLGIPWVTLRLQNVYGEGQSLTNPYTGILTSFSTRIRRGLDLPIFEDGKPSRDFVHVSDVARALELSVHAEQLAGATLNVGSGAPTSLLEVADILVRSFRATSRATVTGEFRAGDIRHGYADLAATRAALGFEPRIALDVGLASFARWVSTQPLPPDRLAEAQAELARRGLSAGSSPQ